MQLTSFYVSNLSVLSSEYVDLSSALPLAPPPFRYIYVRSVIMVWLPACL
jgi:hypothetical protein